jgi:peroxiredoxin
VRKLLVASVVLALFGLACQQETPKPESEATALQEGDRAPAFTLTSPDTEISLSDYRGEKPVLLYFSMGPG